MTEPSIRWPVLAMVMSGVFLSTMDSGMINVALPTIMRSFDLSLEHASFIVSLYLLTITVTLVFWGKLGDRLGRAKVYLARPLGSRHVAGPSGRVGTRQGSAGAGCELGDFAAAGGGNIDRLSLQRRAGHIGSGAGACDAGRAAGRECIAGGCLLGGLGPACSS